MRVFYWMVWVIACMLMLAAGCMTPAEEKGNLAQSTPTTSPTPTAIPNGTPGSAAGDEVTPVPKPSPAQNETVLYHDKFGLRLMQFRVFSLEDLGLPFQQPGERFGIRIIAGKPVVVYVINTGEVPLLETDVGMIDYDYDTRKIDYKRLSPILKMEYAYDNDEVFTIEKTGKYSIVVDGRLSEIDWMKTQETIKVELEIVKLPDE